MSVFIGNPIPKLGAWEVKSLSTNYEALTDGTVQAVQSGGGLSRIFGYTDSNPTPTTLRAGGWSHEDWTDTRSGFAMKVKKGEYWKVTKTGAAVNVFWIPKK